LQRIQYIQRGEITFGEKIRVKIVKNRFVPCLNTIDFDIIYDQGINKPDEVFTLGLSLAVIQHQAEGYTFKTVHLGRTSLDAIRFLWINTQIRNAIESEIRRNLMSFTETAAS
jgi:recombination protein RecA